MQTDTQLPGTRSLALPSPILNSQASTEVLVKSSVVIVGANGSGKTRFGSWVDLESPQKHLVHRIGAQKSLSIPEYCSTSSIDAAENNLRYGYYQHNIEPEQLQNYKMGHKYQSKPSTFLQTDYDKLLTYLFTEEFDKSTKYRQRIRITGQPEIPPETNLDIIKRIWEFVLPHRELIIGAGKIEARPKDGGTSYHASEMSDGERVIFYLIGQCLAAKENGILVIDEPELHLHRALQSRLWDAVEAERPDCIFVYLTHDLDFAVTRVSATKIWLKSYNSNQWDWHLIPENEDIPERLLLEILGSRKPILFVEGDRNSLEYFLFSHLFKNFTVTPCGGHEEVIHSTCSFLKLKTLHNLECKGIIDRDFRADEQVQYLKQRDIFCLDVSEIENLFLSEDVLRIVATALNRPEDANSLIEETKKLVFTHMEKEKERLISAIVADRIEGSFLKFNAKVLGESELIKALNDIMSNIDIPSLYAETNNLVDSILVNQNYPAALRLYNNKGLLPQASSIFGFRTNKSTNELINYIERLVKSKSNEMILKAFQKSVPELADLNLVVEIQATTSVV
ncbi:AAA family ATPase [Nostoc flagelliforme FACHB-838]|uniref:AAA family ATPase n=1 Tax=Nostoc flagelliforme FACHB-838 TaxID=2692904 RepID=A0ABR8DQU7_9NOSO|nr:DUF4435 domain-containing protein [Nostoc flagelliforme]MBD2530565.1 AAA family ATPase [Nostoc flagelliforme FACHB-838]